MADYIEREAVIRDIIEGVIKITADNGDRLPQEAVETYRAVILKYLSSIPAASVKPVVRGEWIDDEFGAKCSVCGIHTHLDRFDRPMKTMFCTHCGADMRGGKNEEG